MKSITPSDFHRIVDSTRGALRFYEKERDRCTLYTNSLYRRVVSPQESFLKDFSKCFHEVVSSTHHVRSCYVSSSYITLEFPELPEAQGFSRSLRGEIVIHLPYERDAWESNCGNNRRFHRKFPWVQWRRPGDSMVFRRRQISHRETPEKIFARCAHYFDVHAIATCSNHKAA